MNKMREDMIKAFVASLEQEAIPWRKKWAELGVRPCNAVTGNNYRGANVLWLMYMQEEMGYKDNRWCTFKQAQEQGWRIRKGEKGTRIEFWSWYDTEKKKRLDWMEMENLRNELEPDEFIKRVKPMDRVSVVFNAQQIEGIPEQVTPHNILDEDTLMAQREILLKNMSLSFYEGGSKAYYQPSTDSVHMPEISLFENEYSYMATFLHEAGHATGHSSRLNRDMQGTFGSPEYAREELRAEIASAFTAQALGLPGADSSFDNHKAYIQNWIQILKKEPNELFRAINDAEKISDYLMEKGVFEQVREKERELPGKTSSERMEEAGQFNPSQEAVIQDGKKLGLDVTVYADPRFSTAQMLQIYYGLKNGVDAGRYAAPDLNALQMKEIRKGLEAGLDVSLYDNPDLTWDQMFQIRWGLVKGLDASIYADPKYNFEQMKEIQKGLEAGLDVSSYADPKYDSMEMKEIRERLRQSLEPVVTILWSEHSHFHDGDTMSLSEANALIESLDRATVAEEGYYKTKFRIDFVMDGQPDNYIGRQDLGDGDGTLIDHIESYQAHYENNEKWDNYVLRNEGREALEADKAYRKMLLQEFVPYLKLHNNLSNMERAAMEALQEGGNMTPEETAYHTAMKAYVSECRRLVNQGEYNLPPVPQLKEFDEELAAYTEHVREEIAQEAAAAGMTVEEYAANGYEPYAAELPAPESKTVYYTINEGAARRANDANSFSDYKPGSATAEYRQMVDKAVEIGERQKKRTDLMYHEKIDRLVDTYARKLAENMNSRFSIEARVPSVLITGGSNFPVQKKEKQNAARDRNMEDWNDIQGLIDRIRGTGMGGISADDPQAVQKLEAKLEKLQSEQDTMKAVNAYYRKHKTLDGCPGLSAEDIEKMKAEMASQWHSGDKPYPSWVLSNNNAEIRRLKNRISTLARRKEAGYVGWEFDGGHVEANTADNRLQVFFDGKPDREIRDDLKGNGFRWSPKAGAWQRQLNDNAIYAADRLSCIQPLTGERPTVLQKKARQEAPGKIDHNLLDEVAKMELDLRVPAEERLARWSGDCSTFEPVRDGLTNQELQEHLDILCRRQIPSREEIYQGMPEEKKQLYDMNMDYGDREGAERLIEEQRQKLQEEENRTHQRQERSVAAHGKIR